MSDARARPGPPGAPTALDRIVREAGVPELPQLLGERIDGADLRSLLLDVMGRRARRRTPAELLRQRRSDATCTASPVDGRALHELRTLALEAAAGFEAVALPPVAPLGLNAVLAGVTPDAVLATIRGTEVLADPTTALALEAALRRRDAGERVALCSVDRVLRLQPFPPPFVQHFELLALVTAGPPGHGEDLELAALREHLAVHLRLLRAARARGVPIASVTVEVGDVRVLRALAREAGADLGLLVADGRSAPHPEAVLAARGIVLPGFATRLAAALPGAPVGAAARRLERVEREVYGELGGCFPDARLGFRPGRLRAAGYYDGLMLEILVETAGGETVSLGDGGTTDWTARLLSRRNERLLTSGLGLERLAGLAS